MKVVFANSAWVSTPERLVLRGGRWKRTPLKVRYGVILHPDHGPVLIDTGYTPETVSAPGRGRMLRLYARVVGATLNEDQQPRPVLARFGFEPADVRFVIVTHFHADHISGLRQFPNARFIANDAAFAHVRSGSDRQNIRHGIFTELLPADFADRLIGLSTLPVAQARHGLPGGRDLFGDGQVVAVDLPGHAEGQFGLLLGAADAPLLYAVDVQWLRRAVIEGRAPGWPARLVAHDFTASQRSTASVAAFLRQGHAALFCHDPEASPHDLEPGKTAG